MVNVIIFSPYFYTYVVLSILSILFSFGGTKKTKRNYIFLTFLYLALFTGLRWEIGTDWNSYKVLFDTISRTTLFTTYHFDIGYVIFNYFLKVIYDNYTFFLVVDSSLALLLIYYTLSRVHVIAPISILIFYTNFFIGHYMGSNRRIIAIGLCLLAIILTYERKKTEAILVIFLSFLFHRSSIIILLVFFIPQRRQSLIKLFCFLFFSAMVGLSGMLTFLLEKLANLFFGITSHYLFSSFLFHLQSGGGYSLGITHYIMAIFKRLILVLLLCYFYKISKKQDNLFNYLFNIYALSIIFYILLIRLGVISVLTTYFTIVEIMLWGILYNMSNWKNKINILFFLIPVTLIQLMGDFPMYPELFFPYKNILFN